MVSPLPRSDFLEKLNAITYNSDLNFFSPEIAPDKSGFSAMEDGGVPPPPCQFQQFVSAPPHLILRLDHLRTSLLTVLLKWLITCIVFLS